MRGIVLTLLAAACMLATGCAQAPPKSAPMPVVENLADDFLQLWDATRALPTPERVERFEREIAPRVPAFYDIARFEGRMTPERRRQQLTATFENFGPIRDAYAAKLRGFEAQLSRNLASFIAAFPDFKADTPIWLLHSLGEMDGGLRDLGGRRYLVFGADGMVRYHAWANESAFFHHELFHVHHAAHLGDCKPLWCTLWQEGLAVYVARRLNPQASDAELLLDVPPGMVERTKRQLPAAFAQLQRLLNRIDATQEQALFQGGAALEGDGLPRRHGYYLGYLVAEELAQTHDMAALARMPAVQAQPLVAAAVGRLAARFATRQPSSL